jgi:hypothetical protein
VTEWTNDSARRHRRGEGGTGSAAGLDSGRLAHYAGQDLEWTQRGWWQPTWELRAGDTLLATLDSVDWWRQALATVLDGERIQFGKSPWRDTAVRERDGAEVGRLHRTGMHLDEDSERLEMSRWWGTGRLDYAGGERAWMKRTPWKSLWTLLDDRGRELATIERAHGPFATRGTMRLASRATERPALALLATFAWWIVTRETARQSHGAH